MAVIANALREVFALPGLQHQTLAAGSDGLKTLEVWMQTLAPGGGTPMHYHVCEEVVVVLRGSGRATVAGEGIEFGPGTTFIIPPKVIHQIVNTGVGEMFLIAALSETPGRAFAPDGQLISLPWQDTVT
jgi:mannose-6-phosphate isomerase-like protein (cupin superfamily)